MWSLSYIVPSLSVFIQSHHCLCKGNKIHLNFNPARSSILIITSFMNIKHHVLIWSHSPLFLWNDTDNCKKSFSSAVELLFSAWPSKISKYRFVHRQKHLQISVSVLWLALNNFLHLSFFSSYLYLSHWRSKIKTISFWTSS